MQLSAGAAELFPQMVCSGGKGQQLQFSRVLPNEEADLAFFALLNSALSIVSFYALIKEDGEFLWSLFMG